MEQPQGAFNMKKENVEKGCKEHDSGMKHEECNKLGNDADIIFRSGWECSDRFAGGFLRFL